MYKITTTVGAAIRRPVRRELLKLEPRGVTFTEDKGLVDSFFVIKTRDKRMYQAIMDWLNRLAAS